MHSVFYIILICIFLKQSESYIQNVLVNLYIIAFQCRHNEFFFMQCLNLDFRGDIIPYILVFLISLISYLHLISSLHALKWKWRKIPKVKRTVKIEIHFTARSISEQFFSLSHITISREIRLRVHNPLGQDSVRMFKT